LILSIFVDLHYYKTATDNLFFSIELIQMSLKVLRFYGWRYSATILLLISIQTCLLLWWGVVFVSVISHFGQMWSTFLIIYLLFTLSWISQLVHAIIAILSDGLILWYFTKCDDLSLCPNERILLYLRVAFTSNFGSLCKAVLFSSNSRILSLTFSKRASAVGATSNSNPTKFLSIFSRMHHRLSYCYIALYGVTYNRATEMLLSNSDSYNIIISDCTNFVLNTTGVIFSVTFAAIFCLIAEKDEGVAWPIFFSVCVCLLYAGISLSLHAIRSATGK